MTPKQQRFVEEYLVDLNATQAAIRAGYSKKTAYEIGRQNLRKLEIAGAIDEAMKARADRTEITADRVLRELAKLGFANMDSYMRVGPDGDPVLDFASLNTDQTAALSEVTVEDFKDGRGEDVRDVRKVKFKLYDKRAALCDIGKHLGMFKDIHEHTGKDGGPIETHELSETERNHRIAAIFNGARARGAGQASNGRDADLDSPDGATD